MDGTNFVKTLKTYQHRKVACLDGWITGEDMLAVYEVLKKNKYGQYLKDALNGRYIDVLH